MENLDNLNIYELRNYARKIGVKCPTQKKKLELINEIIKIETGEQERYFNKNKCGRPIKSCKINNIKVAKVNKKLLKQNHQFLNIIEKQKILFEYLKVFSNNFYILINDLLLKVDEILK